MSGGTYTRLKKDSTATTERKLTKLLKKNKEKGNLTDARYRQLNQHPSKLPHIYELPKIQKDNIPLRQIASWRGSACHPLSQFLVKIITPLSGKSTYYVKNSAHFVSQVKNMRPTPNTQMISFDVVSPLNNVPTDEVLATVRKRLEEDDALTERTNITTNDIKELLTLCVTTTAFQQGEAGRILRDFHWGGNWNQGRHDTFGDGIQSSDFRISKNVTVCSETNYVRQASTTKT